jgi:hypothetical protein
MERGRHLLPYILRPAGSLAAVLTATAAAAAVLAGLPSGASGVPGASARVEPHASFTAPAPRAPQVITDGAAQRLAALLPGDRAVLWVFFTGKDLRDQGEFARAVGAAGARMSERAQARRARETGGRFVPDYYDVPVPASYVDAVAATGAKVRHVSRWLNAVSVEARADEAARIATLPFVRSVAPARASRRIEVGEATAPPGSAPAPATPFEPPARGTRDEGRAKPPGGGLNLAYESLVKPTAYGPSSTQLTGINAIAAQDSGWSAATVILAVFDTGFDKSHPGLSPLRKIAERDFIFGDGETANQAPDVAAQWSHGTGCWGVSGGYWPNQVIGPAYNAGFLLAKTEDTRSETPIEEDNWVAAAEWADSTGADVVTSSLAYFDFDGGSNDYQYSDLNGYTTVVALGAIFAARRGIVVCNAMGNEGDGVSPGTLWSPADADSILSVGAVDSNNLVAGFSGFGPTADNRTKPEVVAQGVTTAWIQPGALNASFANGTSLSTPLVGGAAALVREAHPEWTVAQVRQSLMETADNAGTPNNIRGWGRINVVKAIYGSTLGGPVAPLPFTLLTPAHNASISSLPVTFRWRQPRDLQGGAVTYILNIHQLGAFDSLVYSGPVPDTTVVYLGYLGPSRTYEWHVVAQDAQGNLRESKDRFRFTTSPTTGATGPAPATPPKVLLAQNRPNPFGGVATRIDYSFEGAPGVVPVTLRIFTPSGRLVRTLVDRGDPVPMRCSADWDGRDENGRHVASGIYYYRLEVAGAVYSRRLVLLR